MDHNKKRGKTKVNKPLAERRRRARINEALLQLKSIVLQSINKETTVMSKLEKADILEMTVQYIHNMQSLQGAGTVPGESQYTVGFNECTSHVVNYINNVTDTSVKDDNESSENISRRLLEHLVTVTASKDFLEENKQQTMTDKTLRQDMTEHDGYKTEHAAAQIVATVSQSNPVYKGMSEKTEVKRTEHANEMNYSKTVTIPKKRKAFADFSNFAYIDNTENFIKERAKNNNVMCISRVRDVKSKVMSLKQHTSGEASRHIPKPIKKRLAALVYKPETPDRDSENRRTACTTNTIDSRGSGLIGVSNENFVSSNARRRTNNSICEYPNQVEQANFNNCLFIDTPHIIEAGMYSTHSGSGNHGENTTVQKENEIPNVGVLQPSMDEKCQDSTSRTHFAQHSSDYSYDFYQHYFANGNTENVWRPW